MTHPDRSVSQHAFEPVDHSRIPRLRMLALTGALALLGVACQSTPSTAELDACRQAAAQEKANEQIVRQWYAAVDSGKIDAALALFHPDVKWYSPSNSANPTTSSSMGELIKGFQTAFPRWTHRIEEMLAVDDRVVARTVDITKHEGEFQGIPATGNDVEFSAIVILRLKDGKIIEIREESDVLTLMSQIGMELRPKRR